MATYSVVLAWRVPGTPEPSGLPSMGSQNRTRLKRLSSSSSSSATWEAHYLLQQVAAAQEKPLLQLEKTSSSKDK